MSDLFKFIFRILFVLIISSMIFIVLSLWKGGDWLRYIGKISYNISIKLSDISDRLYDCRKKIESYCKNFKGIVFDEDKKRDTEDH